MLDKSLVCILISSLLGLYTSPLLAATVYASDQLTVPMRTGTSDRHKILRFIPSGDKLELLETNEGEGYSRVMTSSGKEGWVETANIMTKAGGYAQLEKAKQQLNTLRDKTKKLQKTIDELKAERKQLSGEKNVLLDKNESLTINLQEIRVASAEPIKVAEHNQQLQKEIVEEREKNQKLINENEFLSDKSIREWFVIGALVSLGSLFFGLIIPRISWRKKDSWSSNF